MRIRPTALLTEPNRYIREQYRDSRRLSARVYLHQRFSIGPGDWHGWVFDHLNLSDQAQVLELGCGTGALWHVNLTRVPAGWSVTLSDLSPGMVSEARDQLASTGRELSFAVIDAQAIPLKDQSLDCVIANHMLYYVPDRHQALSEIRRVLKASGRLFAATNGSGHMRELRQLVERCGLGALWPESHRAFLLEQAPAKVARWFDRVAVHRYESALAITEVEPLVAYVASLLPDAEAAAASRALECLRALAAYEIARRGCIHVTKDTGLLEASKAAGCASGPLAWAPSP